MLSKMTCTLEGSCYNSKGRMMWQACDRDASCRSKMKGIAIYCDIGLYYKCIYIWGILYIIMCSLWTVRSLWKKKRPSALEFLSFCCSVSWITASRPVLAYSKGALSHSNYSSSWDSNPSQNHISDSPNKSIAPSPTSHSQTARPPSSSVNYSQIIWKS